MTMWNGRFEKSTHALVLKLSQSVSYDQRLAPYDIAGSIAHATMLGRAGIIPEADVKAIVSGLQAILLRIERGEFQFKKELEDVHMNIEVALTEDIGQAGARLHTGRSRNDQIATDERMFLRAEADRVCDLIRQLQAALVFLAANNPHVIMPGYTHMQHAQPILFGHHLLAYTEMLERDICRLHDCRSRLNFLPLGSGAIAGSTLPLDRKFVAKELGFTDVLRNSMDAVADRDYVVEFVSALAIIAMHTSRLAEDIVIWCTHEFSFIELDDAFCTGSSLMPNKKNPDVAELTRGKTGRIFGALIGLLTMLKGLPLAYNRDMQEDKEGLFDALDTVKLILATLAPMLRTARPRAEAMANAAADPALMATDIVEWLVCQGVPFRDAHHQVGRFVGNCARRGQKLNVASLAQMQEEIPLATNACLDIFNPGNSVRSRNLVGGTAPEQIQIQLDFWQHKLRASGAS